MDKTPGESLSFVTSNRDKLKEAEEILQRPVRGMGLALEELQTTNLEELVNHKAVQAYRQLETPLLVEDTSLGFDAWNGLPGPFIKFFEKGLGMDGMVQALRPFGNMTAQAVCGVGYHDGERVHYFSGEIKGTIVEPRGMNGFGWDAIFQPENHRNTFAEMDSAQKHALSMRAQALKKLADFLEAR